MSKIYILGKSNGTMLNVAKILHHFGDKHSLDLITFLYFFLHGPNLEK